MGQRIDQQVTRRLSQREGIGANHHGFVADLQLQARAGRKNRVVIPLHDLQRDVAQIDRDARGAVAAMHDEGAAEELIQQRCQRTGPDQQPVQCAIAGRTLRFVGCEFGLDPDCGDRRTELMRRVGNKGAHGFHLPLQPTHESVQRAQHHLQFARQPGHRDGGQVVGIAPGKVFGDRLQRPQCLSHDGPGDDQKGGTRRGHRQQRVKAQLPRHDLSRPQGLPDDHLNRAREIAFDKAAADRDETGGFAVQRGIEEN